MGRSAITCAIFTFGCINIVSLVTATVALNCANVKEAFSKISTEDDVPDVPIKADLQVCSKTLTGHERTCCTRQTESQYLLSAQKSLLEFIQEKNSFLKSRLTEHAEDYRGKVMGLVKQTLNRTSVKLTEWFGISSIDHRPIVHSLFSDIEDFILLKHVIIGNSVSTFFDHIFPVIFKTVIFQSSSDTWTHHYSHCLSKHRSEIRPRPFGNYPDQIASALNSGLALSQSYLQALNVILDTINTTDHLVLNDECSEAVTRMQYCSHCHAQVGVKPCKGFCMDVMRGCLASVAEIGSEWSDIIEAVEGLVREMSDRSLDEVFKKLAIGISDAIFNTVMTIEEFYGQVQELCEIPRITSGASKYPTFSKPSTLYPEVTGPLSMDVMRVTLDLVDSKNLYTSLADDICTNPTVFDQNPSSDVCWNGTDMAMYVRSPTSMGILEQARNNPEVKVSIVLNKQIRTLKDELDSVNQVLQSHARRNERIRYKNYMISDDPIVIAHSGEKSLAGVVTNGGSLFDDEDLYDSYYSGSGSGSEEDTNTRIIETGIQENTEVEDDNQQTGTLYEDKNQGGILGGEPRRTTRPPYRHLTTDTMSGASDVRPSVLHLLAAMALSSLYVFYTRR